MPPDNFDDNSNDEEWYPQKDYHAMYIAEITNVPVKAQQHQETFMSQQTVDTYNKEKHNRDQLQ